ncbi:MAG: hypothetical protein ACRCU1_00360 [Alsobacter sp.]
MPWVYTRDGRRIEVDAADAERGFRDGTYGIDPTERVRVRLADGSEGTVEARDAGEVVTGGGGFIDEEQAQEGRLEREYGDQTVQAGAEGLARGLTFGLSDAVLAGQSLEAREGLRERQERNAASSSIGEVAGAILPAVFSGGASLEARAGVEGAALAAEGVQGGGLLARLGRAAASTIDDAARVVTAPGRGVQALGQGADDLGRALVRRGLGQGAETVAGRAIERGVGMASQGAVEGALYGGGQAITEAALEDRPLTAEMVTAHVGQGALWGGVGGGIFGGGSSLAGDALSGLGGQLRALGGRSQEAIQSLYQRATGREMLPGVADVYARTAGVAAGGGEDLIRAGVSLSDDGRRLRTMLTRPEETIREHAQGVRRTLDALEGDARAIERVAIGEGKATRMAELMAGVDEVAAATAAREQLGRTREVVEEMLADSAAYGNTAAMRKLQQRIAIAERTITAAEAEGTGLGRAAFIELDQVKRFAGRAARPGTSIVGSADAAGIGRLRDEVYEGLRTHLEDTALWGRAGDAQRDVNAAWSQSLERRAVMQQQFFTRRGSRAFEPIFDADPTKVEAYLRGTGTTAGDFADEIIQQQLPARRQLLDQIARYYDLEGPLAQRLTAARAGSARLESQLGRAQGDMGRINQFREISAAGSETAGVVGAIGGALLGGAPGAAAGAAVANAVSNPARMIRTLATLERVVGRVDMRIGQAVQGFVRRTRAGAQRVAERVSRGGDRIARAAVAPVSIQDYDDRARRVRELAADDAALARRVGDATAGLASAAPQTTAAMAQGSARAVRYLAAQLPRGAQTQTAQPQLAQTLVSDAEKARFLRVARAVETPESILEDLERGRLDHDAVAAVRAVYPELYSRVIARVQDTLSSPTAKGLTYSQRVQLGVLLGTPTDPSMASAAVAVLQSAFSGTTDPSMSPQPDATQTPAPTTSTASALSSDMDRLSSRRGA